MIRYAEGRPTLRFSGAVTIGSTLTIALTELLGATVLAAELIEI